ncbi:MAG: hypothetical protein AAGI38_03370 [Bacteroidota bacterium]
MKKMLLLPGMILLLLAPGCSASMRLGINEKRSNQSVDPPA